MLLIVLIVIVVIEWRGRGAPTIVFFPCKVLGSRSPIPPTPKLPWEAKMKGAKM